MLKEVFVSGCQALTASPQDRERWARWLKVLFRDGVDEAEEIKLHGIVYAVELSNNGRQSERLLINDPCKVVLRRLREERIQALASDVPPQPTPTARPSDDVRSLPLLPTNPTPSPTLKGAGYSPESGPPKFQRDLNQVREKVDLGIRFQVGQSLSASDRKPYYLHPSNTKLNQTEYRSRR